LVAFRTAEPAGTREHAGMQLPPRIPLAQLPTPLVEYPRLRELWVGPHIWVKRDDLTGFGLTGNKVRKLEFHLGAALQAGADTVLTCGAVQSNHCRTTALAAAQVGMRAVLFLRSPDGRAPAISVGNHRLDELAGAEIRYITPEQYRDRDELMMSVAEELEADGATTWVIPEGASDGIGMWGMALGYQELVDQAVIIPGPVAAVWHTSSSAGTTAGFGWAAHRSGFPALNIACSIGDPIDVLSARVDEIWRQAAEATGTSIPVPNLEYLDRYIGGGYGISSDEQLAVQTEATRHSGLLFDPTYTGKSIYGLAQEIAAGRFTPDDHVVFWHTGGGFAALT
jgi:D-cysteine desulfhydrase